MQDKRNNKVRDLFEMLEDPDDTSYVGEEMDEMDLYDKELEEAETDYEGSYIIEDPE